MKMKNNNLYSIIIPVYNGENHIKTCINSILMQTYNNFEVIIIDDGSIDHTRIICEKLAKNNSKIKYIYQENGGVSKARNRGMEESKGDYITFIDIDDYIESNTLELINELLITTKVDIIKYSYYKEAAFISKKYKFSIQTDTVIRKNNYESKLYPYVFSSYDLSNVWNAFYSKKILSNVKFNIDLKYGEDFKFMIDAIKESETLYFLSTCLYHYVYNQNSAINSTSQEKLQTKINDFIKSYTSILCTLPPCEKNIICCDDRVTSCINEMLFQCNFHTYHEYVNLVNNIKNSNQYIKYTKLIKKIYPCFNVKNTENYMCYFKVSLQKMLHKIKKRIICLIIK